MKFSSQHVARPSATAASLRRVRWGVVGGFLVLAFGLAWVIALPLWLGEGLASPLALPVAAVIMVAPATAATIMLAVTRTPHRAAYLGLTAGTGWRSLVRFGLLGAVGAVLVSQGALLIAAAAGQLTLGLSSDVWGALLFMLVGVFLVAVPAIGEEIGWRGFLQQALAPLGTWPALIITGVFWGLWHAPLVLLGYNYGSTDPLFLIPMTVTTILIGVVIGWMRMRTDSVYPGALAHGALNASASFLPAAIVVGGVADTSATVLGWAGWLVTAAVIAVIVAARSLRWSRSPKPIGPAL